MIHMLLQLNSGFKSCVLSPYPRDGYWGKGMIKPKSLHLHLQCKQISSEKTKQCDIRVRRGIKGSDERRWVGKGEDRR